MKNTDNTIELSYEFLITYESGQRDFAKLLDYPINKYAEAEKVDRVFSRKQM